jgi:hypothetical protein
MVSRFCREGVVAWDSKIVALEQKPTYPRIAAVPPSNVWILTGEAGDCRDRELEESDMRGRSTPHALLFAILN